MSLAIDLHPLPYEESPYRPDLEVKDFVELSDALIK